MSQENVETVKRAYAEFNRTLDLPFQFAASDAVIDGTGATPDVGVISDRETAAKAMRAYAEMFESYSITLEEVIHTSEDHVVTAVRDEGRIKGTASEVRNQFFHCITFRDGLVARFLSHTNRAQALEAAGLSE